MRGLPTLVTVLTIAGSVVGTYQLMEAVGPDISESSESGSTLRGTPDAIAGDAPESLFRAPRLATALAKLRDEFGPEAKLSNLRLAPERIDAQVVRGEQRTTLVQLDSDAEVTFRTELETASDDTIPLAQVDPRGPERIMRKTARRYGVGPADVGYLVLTTGNFDDQPGWGAYPDRGGGYFSARLDGGGVRAVGR